MRNWRKWRAEQAARSERARHAAMCRWARAHAAEGAVRETRVVVLQISDSHRPGSVIRLEADQTARGWGRWRVFENWRRVGSRRYGRTAVAALIAKSLL